MNRISIAILVVVAVLGSSSGCASLEGMFDERPTAEIVKVGIAGFDAESITLAFDVAVANPYGVGLPLTRLDYSLSSRQAELVSAATDEARVIPAGATETVPVTARVDFARVLQLLPDLRLGSLVDYEAELGISVDIPVMGVIRLPLRHAGEVGIPALPTVNLGGIRWKSLGLSGATGVLELTVGNENEFPVELTDFNYSLGLGGKAVAQNRITSEGAFGAGEQRSLTAEFSFKPLDFGIGFLRALTGGKAPLYRLSGDLGLSTPFGAIGFPYEREGEALFK